MWRVYVGTYTEVIHFASGMILDGKGKGIHVFDMNPDSGELAPAGVIPGVRCPSYLCLNEAGDRIYAVSELDDRENTVFGTVSSIRVSSVPEESEITDVQSTLGGAPCHVTLTRDEKTAMVCNYKDGSLCIYDVTDPDHLHLVKKSKHEGHSVLARQAEPHVHSIRFIPGEEGFLAADLGKDRLVSYACRNGSYEPDGKDIILPGGCGPRQFAFSSDGRFCYIVCELSGEIALAERKSDRYEYVTKWSAMAKEGTICSELQISSDGRFLYLADKGTNTFSVYEIDAATGLLSPSSLIGCSGANPRHFSLTPDERFLVCANQNTDNIVVFKRDPESGELSFLKSYWTPTPVCVKFFEV